MRWKRVRNIWPVITVLPDAREVLKMPLRAFSFCSHFYVIKSLVARTLAVFGELEFANFAKSTQMLELH
jgi:hypothetical protein